LDNHIVGQPFAQIFDRLSFASSCGTLRCTTPLHVKCVGQSHVGSIGEGSDDKTTIVALILVTVGESGTQLFASDAHVLATLIRLPIKAQLRKPLEMVWVNVFVLVKLINNFSVMFLQDNESHNLESINLMLQFVSLQTLHTLNVRFNLALVETLELFERGVW